METYTTNLHLHLHLQKHHGKEYAELMQATNAEKKSAPQQKTLLIMEKVAEFIVLDDQPLSIVENVGFQHLIEH